MICSKQRTIYADKIMKLWGFKRVILVLIGLLFAISACGATELEQVILNLSENAEVQGQWILLGEIAEITGPKELVAEVSKVNAGAAPRPGSSRRLTKGQIEVRLRQAGIDVKKVEFAGPLEVQIFGRNERKEQNTKAEENGILLHDVVVAARDLRRGDIITAEDLKIAKVELRNAKPDGRGIEELIGLRAKRTILQDTAFTSLNVEPIPVIERGDNVTIVVYTGSLVVTAPGVAKGTGGIGETVSVENSLSKQIVQAEIIDKETVQVNMRGSGTP